MFEYQTRNDMRTFLHSTLVALLVGGPVIVLATQVALRPGTMPLGSGSWELRALGRIERILFALQWLSEPALRQRSHAGLNKGEPAIVRWNTVYLDLIIQRLREQGTTVPDDLLAHVAPLGWEHVALTGDYVWTLPDPAVPFRPLRDVPGSASAFQ
jgi:Tn3 transposase DDE domain